MDLAHITLEHLFDRRTEVERLSDEEEAALILAARGGDQAASHRLMVAYGPALRAAVARASSASHSHAGATDSVDELRARALLVFWEAVQRAEDGRLAGIIAPMLRDGVGGADAELHLPPRARKRLFGALREARQDEAAAERLAPALGMSVESFRKALVALRGVVPLDDVIHEPGDDDPRYAALDDALLVALAFRAVDAEEERVIRMAYGFTDYEPVPDAEIAHRLGTSRSRVQRVRSAGLDKMRAALGAE